MKKASLFYAIIFFTPLFLVSAGIPSETIYKTIAKTLPRDLINNADAEINRLYAGTNIVSNFFAPSLLTDGQIHHIISILTFQNPQPNDQFIESLCEKNNFFKQAVDHFISLASNDIQNVTCKTLTAIEDPTLHQPTKQLDLLPPTLKKWAMNKAKEQIQPSYEMILSHAGTIASFDISDNANLAVTGSFEDRAVKLWDLNKGGAFICNLQNKGATHLSFNADGTRVAEATYYNHTAKGRIQEWNTTTHTRTFKINLKKPVQNIKYFENNSHTALLLTTGGIADECTYSCKPWQCMVLLDKDNNPSFLKTPFISEKECLSICVRREKLNTEKYSALYPTFFSKQKTVTITKKNCHPLYLCEKALKTAQKKNSLKKVKESQSYQALTEYETEMINTQIKKKVVALTAIKQKQQSTATNSDYLLGWKMK